MRPEVAFAVSEPPHFPPPMTHSPEEHHAVQCSGPQLAATCPASKQSCAVAHYGSAEEKEILQKHITGTGTFSEKPILMKHTWRNAMWLRIFSSG